MVTINIGRDFSPYPFGRFRNEHGNASAEEFRERFLEDPIRQGKHVVIEMDDVVGYSASFIDEAFGGLVRKPKIPPQRLKQQLTIVGNPFMQQAVSDYIDEAGAALA